MLSSSRRVLWEISQDAALRCLLPWKRRGWRNHALRAVRAGLPPPAAGEAAGGFVSAGTAISGRENSGCPAQAGRCLSMHSTHGAWSWFRACAAGSVVWRQWGSTVWHAARGVVFQVNRPHAATSLSMCVGPCSCGGSGGPGHPRWCGCWFDRIAVRFGRGGGDRVLYTAVQHMCVYVAGGEGIRVSVLGDIADARPLARVQVLCARCGIMMARL
jgi:hypothetical protein